MATNHYLRFIMRNNNEDVVFQVRKADSERLRISLENANFTTVQFFWFDSLDGRSVIINLSEVQAVRYLWNPTGAASDHIRNEGMIEVILKGKDLPLELGTEELAQLYDFFASLENGPDVQSYPSFEDEDGELIQFNASEIVMVSAPTHMLNEGKHEILEEDGLKN